MIYETCKGSGIRKLHLLYQPRGHFHQRPSGV